MTGKLETNKNNKNKNDLLKTVSKKTAPYGRYRNVYLSEEETELLQETVVNWKDYVERLSSYMVSQGKEYQNHAATILHWAERDGAVRRKRDYSFEKGESL